MYKEKINFLRQSIEQEAVEKMAKVLLDSEKKELKKVSKFSIPDGVSPIPAGVYPYSPGRYALLTPDGLAEIFEGDYILQTKDNQFYYIRMEKIE